MTLSKTLTLTSELLGHHVLSKLRVVDDVLLELLHSGSTLSLLLLHELLVGGLVVATELLEELLLHSRGGLNGLLDGLSSSGGR
jgi:hypothetical protein